MKTYGVISFVMIMRYESSDGFKKGDLWSNSFIMLMRDHYGVKCIMNRTDVWNERQKNNGLLL